ncbi:hypothetical protein QN362_15045 [Actimicrobium sp. CCC2.4]|uniref:hypothetical protein n=1 Tax=Actimicrobium sp. CCC2.4 TaxID=3048606 RepID=UPI002AC8C080|nr:hypothetical protein [Actimicrobium sp. CCC2.4]MEB0136652.1 hypothetical protein [Actimicrobium sp. CCC2.4]WPX31664.1 hypothetical protein RHM62_15690 [Actimicrobium sp. CCC2.4]
MLRLVMTILWPAFLAAIAATGLFFSLFDPSELLLRFSVATGLPDIAWYTIGFFSSWLFCALSSLLTLYLMQVPDDRTLPF